MHRRPSLSVVQDGIRQRSEPHVSLVDRIPPNSIEAEMALLGSVLVDKEMLAAVGEIIRPNDFYSSQHETIYLALCALFESGRPLDKVALAEELRSHGMLEKVGGLAYLSSLMDTVPTAASAEYYAKVVREKAMLRGLIHAGTRITQLGYESEDDVPAALEEARAIAEHAAAPVLGDELETIDATELLSAPYVKPRFIVEHLLVSRGITLLSADTGGLKTALLMHMAIALALAAPVAGRFATFGDGRPVLYINGEMSADSIKQYLHQAAGGFGASVPPNRLHFVGAGALAELRLNARSFTRLRRLIEDVRPCLVVFDTFRALFDGDENDARDVRPAFRLIRDLCEEYDCAAAVAHHQRKWGPVSNDDRERVAGSRDIIASVDIHLVLKSRSGRPLQAIKIDKTRFPDGAVNLGTEWPVSARLELGERPRSIITADEAAVVQYVGESGGEAAAKIAIVARLRAEGPLTIDALGADRGTAKRAFGKLCANAKRGTGEVVEIGKIGRKAYYGLPGQVMPTPVKPVTA
jgi:hypothetical protein